MMLPHQKNISENLDIWIMKRNLLFFPEKKEQRQLFSPGFLGAKQPQKISLSVRPSVIIPRSSCIYHSYLWATASQTLSIFILSSSLFSLALKWFFIQNLKTNKRVFTRVFARTAVKVYMSQSGNRSISKPRFPETVFPERKSILFQFRDSLPAPTKVKRHPSWHLTKTFK